MHRISPARAHGLGWVVGACAVALAISACGHHHWSYDGSVFLDNRTDQTTVEFVDTFRMAAFGEPYTGNLLGSPLPPGATDYIGRFHEDYYDAEADLELGDLVEWFDIWVGDGDDVYFEVF